MSLTREEVLHVAELAKLGLTAEEVESYRGQLGVVLEHIALLNELDTSQVAAMAHVTGQENVWREDTIRPSLPVSDVLAAAPAEESDSFRVPVVLEG